MKYKHEIKINYNICMGIFCIICIALSVILSLIFDPNNKQDELKFSHPSGFYDNEFDLEIKGEGDIYYTLDGSIPTENSIKYTGPIHISDASKNPNTISMIEDSSVCFDKNIDKLNIFNIKSNCQIYSLPSFLIDKATIIRAIKLSDKAHKNRVKTASYFVGFNKKIGYKNIGIISLILDPDYLFGNQNGIYNIGLNNNYNIKGKISERQAYVEVFNEYHKLSQRFNLGLRVRGGVSRVFPKKSFNIYARKEYNNQNLFKKLIRTNYIPRELTLFSGAADQLNSLDYIIHSLVKNDKLGTFNFKHYILFLNGEYWGLYWITEKYDKYYLSHLYNIKNPDDIIIIKNNQLENGRFDDYISYMQMTDFIKNIDLTKQENLAKVEAMIDLDSFIKFYSIQVYINNQDFNYTQNTALWKTRTINNSKYNDGKWRWLLFDMQASLPPPFIHENNELLMSKDYLFSKFMTNNILKHKFANEIIKLSINEFTPDKVIQFIEKYKYDMQDVIIKNVQRYSYSNKVPPEIMFYNNIIRIEDYFIKRPRKIYQRFCKELDYTQDIEEEVKNVCSAYK